MISLAQIVDSLEGKREGTSWRCRCPAHNGRSLAVSERDGKLLVYCHAGCAQQDVLDALRDLGLWGDAADPYMPPPLHDARPIAEYEYTDDRGRLLAIKGRFVPKDFRWRLPGSTEWAGLKPAFKGEQELPLYGCDLLAARPDDLVFLTEGEKAAQAYRAVGLLAVCGPGGAASKQFGTALDALTGRDVVLSPDNDDTGRELMKRIERLIHGRARSVRWLPLDVPQGGDAFDYFGRGGSVEVISESLAKAINEPSIEHSADGYLVHIPESGGLVSLQFDDLLAGRGHALDADVTITMQVPGVAERRFWQRLNLASGSARNTLRTSLNDAFGDFDWANKLSTACEMAREAWRGHDPSILLMDAPDVDIDYLFSPFLLSDGPSMIFGMGGTGKTTLALAIALCLSMGLPLIGGVPHSGPVLYVDYEWTERRLRRRLLRLITGMGLEPCLPPVYYWPGRGIALAEQVDAIKRKVARDGIVALIVDSVGYACGGDPLSQERATTYWNALSRIGVPSLSIAHNTKDDDRMFPLGAVYWHNGARITWNIQYARTDTASASLGIFNRKANDDAGLPPVALRVDYGDEAISLRRLSRLPQAFDEERDLADRLHDALILGPRSLKDLTAAVQGRQRHTQASVRAILNRQKDDFLSMGRADDRSGLWVLKA